MDKKALCFILAVCNVCMLSSEPLTQPVYFNDTQGDSMDYEKLEHPRKSCRLSPGSCSAHQKPIDFPM